MKVFPPTTKKFISWFLIFVMTVHLTSCNFYQVQKLTRYDISGIRGYSPADKRMIIHAGDETFMLSNFSLDSTSTFISGDLVKIDSSWYFYNENRSKRFKMKEKDITKEIHFYLNEGNIQPPYAEIPLQDLKEIRVIKYDNGTSFVTSIIFIGGTIVVLYYALFIISFLLFYRA